MAGNPANTYELVVEQQGKTPALVFGSWQNWVVAFVTLAIVVALNHYGKGLFKLASILIGLLYKDSPIAKITVPITSGGNTFLICLIVNPTIIAVYAASVIWK